MLRYVLFAGLALGIGFLIWDLGQRGARGYERMLSQRIENGLDVLGYSWARVDADGLRVELHGHAPDMFERELAYESAKATAPIARISNFATATLAPPERRDPVRVELHRDKRGVTMTGQTASRQMRERLNQMLARADPDMPVQDLTGIQAALPRRRLMQELTIATLAASTLPNAYVVIEPGKVIVDGQTKDEAARSALSRRLLEAAEDKVAVDLRLRIPPEVIAPFGFSAYRDPGGAITMERCAVRSEDERTRIETRFSDTGPEARAARCQTGLGGPGGAWPDAIESALAALETLPAGRVDLEYRAARLVAMPPTTPAAFEAAQEMFLDGLPEGFDGTARLDADDIATRTAIAREAYWLHIARTEDGVTLAGQVPGDDASVALATYAGALFGGDRVITRLTVNEAPAPDGWRIAALRALDHLAVSTTGDVQMGGYGLQFRARVPDPLLARDMHSDLTDLLPDWSVKTAMVVDLPIQLAGQPLPGPRCADVLNRLNHKAPIDFKSGSARITSESKGVLDDLSGVLRRCFDARIEVGGHTDSQGSDSVNQRISQARAEAVVAALAERGTSPVVLVAKGYGEAVPIADNSTEQGRARNRRIEFLSTEAEP